MARVLVSYGTGEGQTARIAEYIAQAARDRGHDAEAVDIKDLPGGFQPAEYGAVIVGASVHGGEHEGYVRDFVERNRELLERFPSAFFSVSLTAAEETEEARSQTREFVEKFVEETGWRPRRIGVFAGAVPYTRYGFVKRHLVKRIVAKKHPADTDTSRDYEYTDWEDIGRFVDDFLTRLS
jgi:menaquinone-dependent protoporphyrinogen oxidase